jgi:murein DD-endopeptidase MepM/ murein hydrolase activator NlpD
MRRALAVVLVALAATGGASAGTFDVVPTPATAVSTATGETAPLLPQLMVPPAQPQVLSWDQLLPLWQGAGQQYGIPWSVLAAINKVESNFGQNMGPSSAGAIGWMQFMPATWAEWGYDADGNGVADPWNATDAIYSAARYLAASGGATDISRAVFAYNHAQWYVDEVLQLAQQFQGGGADFSASLQAAQQALDTAKQAVLAANGKLLAAESTLVPLQENEDKALAVAEGGGLLSTRLAAQKQATLLDLQVQRAQAAVDARRVDLENAQAALASARQEAAGMQLAPGTTNLLQAPVEHDGYVFPVGGGPGVVSVGHTHHDYPAADIDAPAGTQEYALHDGTVVAAWPTGDGGCGIGFEIATTDGLEWTYCHMSYLEPAVTQGAQLSAGAPVGLVGQTGDATGPHLHLQLDPSVGYPQQEPWFQAFAGTAFTWSDQVQANAAPETVFAVVAGASAPATAASEEAAAPLRNLDSAASPVVYFTTSGG